MKISERTIQALARVITGEAQNSPYKSGRKLVRFFNELGLNDVYGQGFSSRLPYTEDSIRSLNDTSELFTLFKAYFDPGTFMESGYDIETAIEYMNQYLRQDGYEIVPSGSVFTVNELNGAVIQFRPPFQGSNELNHQFIDEQIEKCDKKILEGDYDGAITNARSLIEAVLIEIEGLPNGGTAQYDGDMIKLYKRVQGKLNLEPGNPELSTPLKQVLSGLNNIVTGLAGLRNKMSDAHVRTYKPGQHHARLAVNSAKTLANFLFDTYSYQQAKRDIRN